jgi:HEAT repeat protein
MSPGPTHDLLDRLAALDPRIRWRAAEELARRPDVPAFDALVEHAVSDDNDEARRCAVSALGARREPGAFEILVPLLCDPAVGYMAATALGAVGDPRGVGPLLEALAFRDLPPPVQVAMRIRAIEALGELRAVGAVGAITARLADGAEDLGVRVAAARVLGELRAAEAVPPLVGVLDQEDAFLRQYATIALGEIGDLRAVDPLLACLERRGITEDAGWIAEALGALGDARALPALLTIACDRSSMEGATPAWVRARAVEALGALGDASVLPTLVDALRDESVGVRLASAKALGNLADPRAVVPLREAMRDDDGLDLDTGETVRAAAARALAKLRGGAGGEVL